MATSTGRASAAVSLCAKLPNREYDGTLVYLLDWKVDGNTVSLRYLMSRDSHTPILDEQLPVTRESCNLVRPNKSEHWKLDRWEDVWRNEKTGRKVYA